MGYHPNCIDHVLNICATNNIDSNNYIITTGTMNFVYIWTEEEIIRNYLDIKDDTSRNLFVKEKNNYFYSPEVAVSAPPITLLTNQFMPSLNYGAVNVNPLIYNFNPSFNNNNPLVYNNFALQMDKFNTNPIANEFEITQIDDDMEEDEIEVDMEDDDDDGEDDLEIDATAFD